MNCLKIQIKKNMLKKEKKMDEKREKNRKFFGKFLNVIMKKKHVIWRKLLKALNLWGTFKWIAQYDVQFVQINRKTKIRSNNNSNKIRKLFHFGQHKKRKLCAVNDRDGWWKKEIKSAFICTKVAKFFLSNAKWCLSTVQRKQSHQTHFKVSMFK